MHHSCLLLALCLTAGEDTFDRRSAPFPPELVQFVPHEKNPVFEAGGTGKWDVRIRERGWIMREGNLYRMWYTGYDGTREGLKMLGYATSPDGVTWTRHPNNPVYREHWVEDMMVLRREGTYHMFAEGEGDRAQLLTSKDGIDWERVGPLDVRRADGKPIPDGPYGTPTVFLKDGVWHLFYERSDRGVWLAASKDMKVWTNVQDEPVMKPGPAEHERDLIALNQVIEHKGTYYAYYHGSARAGEYRGLWSTCVARSPDLIHWEKYPGNPIQPASQNKSSGILVDDGKGYRLYTTHERVHLHLHRPETKP